MRLNKSGKDSIFAVVKMARVAFICVSMIKPLQEISLIC